jgi:hypothetical protein
VTGFVAASVPVVVGIGGTSVPDLPQLVPASLFVVAFVMAVAWLHRVLTYLHRMAKGIETVQLERGLPDTISPAAAVGLSFVGRASVAHVQHHANRIAPEEPSPAAAARRPTHAVVALPVVMGVATAPFVHRAYEEYERSILGMQGVPAPGRACGTGSRNGP